MTKYLLSLSLLTLFLWMTACAASGANQSAEEIDITVFRAPTWGCCGGWIEYLEENGYKAKVKDVQNLAGVKAQYHVPPQLQSCHTAIVDGYIIEGHVPLAEIERLRVEKPDILGIAVPGMPVGSPGMEVAGAVPQPFDVLAFSKSGTTEIYASYPKWVAYWSFEIRSVPGTVKSEMPPTLKTNSPHPILI